MSQQNAVVPYDASRFAVMGRTQENLKETLSANIGNGGLSAFDLDRIKIPAQGGESWKLTGLTGNAQAESFDCIIIHWKDSRLYYATPIEQSGGKAPPDCISRDCVTGVGDPGGDCETCPHSQWGSAARGDGQACKQIRTLFVLREHSMLPDVIQLPPTSLRDFKKYMLRLANHSTPYFTVVTRMGLAQDKNSSGIAYSKAVPTVAGKLTPEQIATVIAYRDKLLPALEKAKIEEE